MNEQRYDVVYGNNKCDITFHFCREWNEHGEGCYGTDPTHGFTFEEAKKEVVEFYTRRVNDWSTLTERNWLKQHGY